MEKTNQPTEDFYITGGHEILFNGTDTKAINIPGSKVIDVDPEPVYTLCTEKRCHVLINGLAVATHSKEAWTKFAFKRGLKWHTI